MVAIPLGSLRSEVFVKAIPFSSHLFILVTQVHTSMLNTGLVNCMIPGFNPNLNHNFNHLMFADDLILVTQASRRAARGINQCLNVYGFLTGQRPNFAKSHIFFPTWCNKHVSSRIRAILNLTQASFPFKYLGILISPKRLAVSTFKPMIDKIRLQCNRWSNFNLSSAAKATLINYSLLSIPTYTLSVYTIPEVVISEITKVVRKFYWCRNGNGKGIHNVNWKTLNEGKPEGGIGIRNLSLAKSSLMAKHVFGFLNRKDGIWVDVLSHKYGKLDFWRNTASVNYSWFYRSLHKAAAQIKPFCRINSINPALTFFCWDPWCFDIPIALTPTFINMNVDVNLLSVSDVVNGDRWCDTSLLYVFGPNFNL
ncbi:uncharacterized protein LOC120256290 [Dioscorea cayenensis subsp. rotundata]|uniref:Uncharacterized protein LOC120256290 n=1 Tax=Dioscorea cayennensis subsp. rotundata TaxID=55577 RepID=A0AB40AYB5_DIOCR|nr:uncharacterized protein LOC120256290 [Dioscorea cayenensis subsp. rotundata]